MVNSPTLEKLQQVSEKEWKRIYKALVLYADLKLKIFGFEVRTEVDSVDAESFAAQAIEKLFDGSRAWDYERFPDLLIHLKGIVKSLLSNHFKASSKSIVKSKVNTSNEKDNNTDEVTTVEIDNDLEIFDNSPEEITIAAEKWAEIEASFGDDDDGCVIFTDWLDNNSPRDIAKAYGFDIKDVYNAIRKGKRNVKSLFKKR